jgi:hypothetical protein
VSDEVRHRAGYVHAVCSGALERFARTLAARAAASAVLAQGDDDAIPDPRTVPMLDETRDLPLAAEMTASRRERLAGIEQSYDRYRAGVVTDRALRDMVHAHQIDWIRLDCRTVEFHDASVAAEAALCVREDGADLADIAREAGEPLADERLYLDQLGAEARGLLLGGSPGEIVGPLSRNGGFVLHEIRAKALPTASDPELRRRAEDAVLAAALAAESQQRVRWAV